MSTYEVHFGTWRRGRGQFLSYDEFAEMLIP